MRKRWIILAVLFFARTAMAFQYQSIATVSSFLMTALNIDFAQLGTLIGLYQLPGIFLAFPGGLLGKKFGDKRVVVAALGLMAFGGGLMGVSDSFTWAVVGRFLSGAGAVLFNVLSAKMIADWFAGHEIVTAMAILVTSWPLGIALAMTSLGPLALAASWLLVMQITAAVCVVAFVLVAAIYHSPAISVGSSETKSAEHKLSPKEIGLVFLAGLIWTTFNAGFAILPGFAPDFLVSTGYMLTEAGSLVSVVSWLLVLSLPLGGYIAERLGRQNLIMFTCLSAIGVATLLLPYWAYPLVLLVSLGLLYGPPPGIIVALPVEVLHPENRAPGMGIFYTIYYAGMAILVAVTGFIRDQTQDPATPLLFSGALIFITILIIWLFRTFQKKTISMPSS